MQYSFMPMPFYFLRMLRGGIHSQILSQSFKESIFFFKTVGFSYWSTKTKKNRKYKKKCSCQCPCSIFKNILINLNFRTGCLQYQLRFGHHLVKTQVQVRHFTFADETFFLMHVILRNHVSLGTV